MNRNIRKHHIALLALFMLLACGKTKDSSQAADSSGGKSAAVQQSAGNHPAPQIENWSYDTIPDKEHGGTKVVALLEGTSTVNFDAPYAGGSHGEIMIKHSAKGSEALFSIVNGVVQSDKKGADLAICFDNGPVEHFNGSGAEGDTSNLVFIDPSQKFIDEVKKAHHMTVEAPFYKAGRKQVAFDMDALKWQ